MAAAAVLLVGRRQIGERLLSRFGGKTVRDGGGGGGGGGCGCCYGLVVVAQRGGGGSLSIIDESAHARAH